ncbi:MAG: acyl-CoA thioesterase [Betaproteobacteria bacterium]|nr:MAG: acyl-CoA thioesterase [Betaproteobacteria bacterium]
MTATVRLPDKPPVLRVVPLPADVNQHGDIFGGWIMSQVDIAGSIPAARRARGRVATVAVNAFLFKEPVLVGDVVTFFADVERTGRTSITVSVEVYATRNPREEVSVKVTEATLTYVAVGEDRRPHPLPDIATPPA